jgi:CubicO group peptidase (beta-lactamase class C family)
MIGSISKSFASIVALQEVEAGRLDLHVSVNELLPWLELPEPFGPITCIIS